VSLGGSALEIGLNSHTDSSAGIVDIAAGLVRILNDAYASNAYVMTAGSRALVVDPSDAKSGRIARFLHARGVTEILIVLTHEHFDHISGVSHLENEFPKTHVLSSRACSERIVSPALNLSRYMTSENIVCALRLSSPRTLPCRTGGERLTCPLFPHLVILLAAYACD
jgi:glyoxylase-like metal-dependent hydrolase (beta-lactamase superfamily II)